MNKSLLTTTMLSSCALMSACGLHAANVSSEAGKAPKAKPNVLVLFIDDLSFDCINALGNHELITPNLDKIIKAGTSFHNTYNMGGWNGAVSIASRTQLMTGMYLWNAHEEESKLFKEVLEERRTWPMLMEDNGYETFMTGKWHMKNVNAQQVFRNMGAVYPGGMPKTCKEAYNRPLSVDDTEWTSWDTSFPGYWSPEGHRTVLQSQATIDFIKDNKDNEKPLFLYCAFNAAHDPRQAPREFVEMYDVNKIAVPENFQPIHPSCEAMGAGRHLRDEMLAPFPRTEYAVKKHRQEYYGLISHLDAYVGKIMEALEESGRADNTLIIVAADNGLSVGQHGLMGKQSMYEHSMKIPLVFTGCGVPANTVRNQLVYLQDFVPTICDLVGIEYPDAMQFHSLKKALFSKNAKTREYIYGAYTNTQRMVRSDRYKLIFIPKNKSVELYDVVEDPLEMHNLYGKPGYEKIVKDLASTYVELAKEYNDPIDITPNFPDLF